MTGEELEAIRQACEKATGGVWRVEHHDYGDEWWFGGIGAGEVVVHTNASQIVYGGNDVSDAEFIAGSRQWVPALLDEIDRLRGLAVAVVDAWWNHIPDANVDARLYDLMAAVRPVEAE